MNIRPLSKSNNDIALFELAFRPMFLLGTMSAVISLLIWITQYSGWYFFDSYWDSKTMHSHEMLYGFIVVIIAGFLLTAAKPGPD
jgi:uncharacterized protein involved in response to NO